jgi:hypothetical protein
LDNTKQLSGFEKYAHSISFEFISSKFKSIKIVFLSNGKNEQNTTNGPQSIQDEAVYAETSPFGIFYGIESFGTKQKQSRCFRPF